MHIEKLFSQQSKNQLDYHVKMAGNNINQETKSPFISISTFQKRIMTPATVCLVKHEL